MKNRFFVLFLLCSAGISGALLASPSDATPPLGPIGTITAAELKSLLGFFASDEMQGRNTNSPENRIAARYLAQQFEMLGLEPSGADGTYFQQVELVRARLGESNSLAIRNDSTAEPVSGVVQTDFIPSTYSASTKAEGSLLFAGYGISAPELSYDDYAGIDATGKIVLVMSGRPGSAEGESPFASAEASQYRRDLYKIKNAQDHGAAAVLIFYPDREGDISRLASRSFPEDPERSRLDLKVQLESVTIPAMTVSADFLTKTLAGTFDFQSDKKQIDEAMSPRSRVLEGASLSVEADVDYLETPVSNVVALIPGSDERLKDEVVVVGAHYDHVGARGEHIYNGADDDGSGTVAILEIAEAFIESGIHPKRSVLFALWNAEERGLLGSRYYVESPVFPIERTKAMFQLDMIGRNQEIPEGGQARYGGMEKESADQNVNMVHMIGYSFSRDMEEIVETQNRQVGLELRRDMENHKLNLMRRSDHWPFLEKGVPSIFFTTGLHPDYHTPGDTPDKIDYGKLERVTRLAFLCVLEAANRDQAPALNPAASASSEEAGDGE